MINTCIIFFGKEGGGGDLRVEIGKVEIGKVEIGRVELLMVNRSVVAQRISSPTEAASHRIGMTTPRLHMYAACTINSFMGNRAILRRRCYTKATLFIRTVHTL